MYIYMVEGGGFEPPKAEPSDLQSDPFDHSGTPPKCKPAIVLQALLTVNTIHPEIVLFMTIFSAPAQDAACRSVIIGYT